MILAAIWVVGGFLVGWALDRIVLGWARAWAARTSWTVDDDLVKSLSGLPIWWFGALGLYAAVLPYTDHPRLGPLADTGLTIVFIGSLTWLASSLAVGLVGSYTRKTEGLLPPTSMFVNLTRGTVLVIGGLVLLQTLGVSIAPILTALGVGGLAAALALQDTLSNLFAGLHVLVARQVRVGDFIKLESGEEGTVTDIGWRNAMIRTLPNNIVVIPNARLASTVISNYSLLDSEMAALVQVGVSYAGDLAQVERVTIEVARDVQRTVTGGVATFEPFIRYHTFGESSVNFTVILRGRTFVDQYLLKHEFVKRLHRQYQAEGIEIPFPIRTVHLKDDRAGRGTGIG